MYNLPNRAILIAASLLVTIAITSSVIMVIGFFKDVYTEVEGTDISIRKMFNEYDPYDNTTLTGIDILNGYNKYRNNGAVTFTVNGVLLNADNVERVLDESTYSIRYSSTCDRIDDGAAIFCTKIN